MDYDYRIRKIVAILSSALDAPAALNVVGHLSIALGLHADRDLLGRPELLDASGVKHLGIARYPVIITRAKPAQLRAAIHRARATAGLVVVDYPREMLDTGPDDELASALGLVREDGIDYLGAILYGPAGDVDGICRRFSLWREPGQGRPALEET